MTGKIRNRDALKLKCPLARECRFFQKYKSKKSITWLGMFASYCCSDGSAHCSIYQTYQSKGQFLHPDILPTGGTVSPAFQSLK